MSIVCAVLCIVAIGCQPQPIGGDKDEHGCLIAAGYSWCEDKQKCIRAWEEDCGKHICTAEESTNKMCTMEYAPVCGEIVLNSGKTVYQTFGNGCGACAAMKVVSYTQGECPADTTEFSCTDTKGNTMTLGQAVTIALSSECGDALILDPSTYVCNEGTSTLWINLDLQKEGCSPACVINLETATAEINWRCTGLVVQ